MGIVNRRNAFFGWVAWQVMKQVLARKARKAVPSVDGQSRRPNAAAILAVVALVAGGLFFWRNWSGEDEPEG